MKSISNDRARCAESDDMSFNQNSRGFTTENMSFLVVLCILSGMMELRREQEGKHCEVATLSMPTTHSNFIVF